MGVSLPSAAALRDGAGRAGPVRVMVVDDSAVIRGLIHKTLSQDPGIEVVASVGNGQLAVQQVAKTDIDAIVLDIEMPVMDGLTALPEILRIKPTVAVIIASTLSQRGAEISLKALSLGAADYIPKPTSGRDIASGDAFKRELCDKVRSLGARARDKAGRRRLPAVQPVPAAKPVAGAAPTAPRAAVALRPAGTTPPRILAIGSSTGGPQALFALLKGLPRTLRIPIIVTQHMPPTFTSILAQHINKATGWPTREAMDGDRVEPGTILLAPGDHHMLVERREGRGVVRLNQGERESFCRPAVDPMLRSVVRVYGAGVLAVILTGMGRDGLEGSRQVVAAGGTVVAQDEETSVVWGMPGAVALAGICSAVLPLPDMASQVLRLVGGAPAAPA